MKSLKIVKSSMEIKIGFIYESFPNLYKSILYLINNNEGVSIYTFMETIDFFIANKNHNLINLAEKLYVDYVEFENNLFKFYAKVFILDDTVGLTLYLPKRMRCSFKICKIEDIDDMFYKLKLDLIDKSHIK